MLTEMKSPIKRVETVGQSLYPLSIKEILQAVVIQSGREGSVGKLVHKDLVRILLEKSYILQK